MNQMRNNTEEHESELEKASNTVNKKIKGINPNQVIEFENLNCKIDLKGKLVDPLYFIDGSNPILTTVPNPYDIPIGNFYDFASVYGNTYDYSLGTALHKACKIISDRLNSVIDTNYRSLEYNYLIREVAPFLKQSFPVNSDKIFFFNSNSFASSVDSIVKHSKLIGVYIVDAKIKGSLVIANHISSRIADIMNNIDLDAAGVYFLKQCDIDPSEVKDRKTLYMFVEGCLQEIAKNINLKMNGIIEINMASSIIAVKHMVDAMGEPTRRIDYDNDYIEF